MDRKANRPVPRGRGQHRIAKYLTEGGLINQNELPELFENGSFTPAGKRLPGIRPGRICHERGSGQDPCHRRDEVQPGNVLSKPLFHLLKNSKLREEGRIIDDINTGIKYLYGAKKAGMTLREYFLQSNMFEAAYLMI